MKTEHIKIGQRVRLVTAMDHRYNCGTVVRITTHGPSDWALIRFDNTTTGCYDIRDLHLEEALS